MNFHTKASLKTLLTSVNKRQRRKRKERKKYREKQMESKEDNTALTIN